MAFIDQREVKVAWSSKMNDPKDDRYIEQSRTSGIAFFFIVWKKKKPSGLSEIERHFKK